ncbi:DUF550 domain-containing protein [Escherichia coli]|nr:DUF550 domain-containing protein [Escherichia coli]EQO10697.1 hypothetical protein G704_01693 [Escherichia coli HVH 28 (4-0907367)]EHT4057109.1 DUF550 domain-containing protein [Escherichia coli]EIU0371237.1 DUF550 domain-containing protein [Escherichia coli]EJD4744897.1 DUF550 domain-containing protein [Escherichia coli]
MTTFTDKELIKEIKERIGSLDVRDNIERRAYEIALASLEAKPIGAFHIAEQQVDGTSDYLKDGEWPIDNGIIEVYAAPPMPVVPEEKPMPNPLKMYAVDAVAAIAEVRGWNACRAAMLQGVEPASNHEELSEENGSSLQLRNLIRQRHAEWSDKTFGCVGPVGPLKHLSKEALEAAAEPDDLSEWADMQFLLWDAQRRAGISDAEITAAMEDKLKINMERQWPEPKDGEPRLHIKEPGNSPVTPDGWISCSERMPEKGQNVLISVNFDSSLVEPLICSARYTGSTFRRGDATIKQGNGIEQATHWMPLPEPPQEVK